MSNHLNYYKKINKIPTIDLIDLKERVLFLQRKNYYFNIGLTQNSFQGKNILEFCPGTGYNAYFLTKQFKIKKIKLIENNPSSIKFLKKNLSKFNNNFIYNKDLNKFKTKEKFDFVIMENALDNFSNEKSVIKKIISFTKNKGNIILTLGDKYGILSTKLRYIFSLILLEQNKISNFQEKVYFLSNVFKSHLNYLSKNTRKADKWVLDNILNIDYIRKKNYIDYPNLIHSIGKKVYIQNVSPQFNKNFIFYKNFELKKNNRFYLKQYFNQRKNFLDFETSFEGNLNIEKHLDYIYREISKLTPNRKINIVILNNIRKEILKMIEKLDKLKKNNKVLLALKEFSNILLDYKKKKIIKKKTKYLKKF